MNTWRGKCNQELQGRTIDYSPGYIYILVFLYIAISIDLGQLMQIKNNDKNAKMQEKFQEVQSRVTGSFYSILHIYWYNQEKCPVETFITLADIEPGPSPQSITLFLLEAHPNMQAFIHIFRLSY